MNDAPFPPEGPREVLQGKIGNPLKTQTGRTGEGETHE